MVFSRLFSVGQGQQQDARVAHALRSVPLFRDLPSADLVALWRRLQEVRIPAGDVLCRRGDAGDYFYVLQAGLLEVRLGLEADGLVLRHIGPGDFVGEMALLTGGPRSADVVAMEDSLLWALARRDFDAVLESSPSLPRAFTRALCERLASLTQIMEERGLSNPGVTGLRFGPYRVVEQIGAGGMASVYSAVHVRDGTAAAIKVLPGAWGRAPELQARLSREAGILQQLDHPHVVHLHAVGTVESGLGGGLYVAMEWLPHGLDRVLWAQYPEPLDVAEALRIAQGVAEGLAAVHALGVVHRDIKPSNIMLRADGTPVLTDFGLAAARTDAAARQQLTPADVFVGTADYLAPEVALGGEVTGQADLYALGVVLYEMLAGLVPFAGRPPLEAIRAHVEEEPPALPPTVPLPLRAVVERALRKRPDERYSSADGMAAALAALRAT